MRGSRSIRSLRLLLASAAAGLLVAGCAQSAADPTPDPRIDDLQEAVGQVSQTLERLEGEVERLGRKPTPTPGPTLDQIGDLVDTRVSRAIAAIPTATPPPVPTPSMTKEEARSLMDEAIETSVSMALAAMPGPLGTVREAHVSGGVDGVHVRGRVAPGRARTADGRARREPYADRTRPLAAGRSQLPGPDGQVRRVDRPYGNALCVDLWEPHYRAMVPRRRGRLPLLDADRHTR